MLTSSWDVSEVPCKLSGSDEPPPGAAWRAGIPWHSPCWAAGMRPSGHAGLSHLNLPVLINHSGTRNK